MVCLRLYLFYQYRYRLTQQQDSSSDCGLFAVVFAAVLASGCHPSSFKFKQADMREHLRQCLVANQLSDFPTTKKREREEECCEEKLQNSSVLPVQNARSF